MTPSDIRCRLCDNPYSYERGCEVCVPAKRNIKWPNGSVGTDLERALEQNIRILRTELDKLEEQQRGLAHRQFSPQIAGAAGAVGRVLASLVAEARKLEDHVNANVAAMSYDEQVVELLRFFEELPPHHQERLVTRIAGFIEATKEPPKEIFDAELEDP